MDATIAFLNRELDEDVYTDITEGWTETDRKSTTFKLVRPSMD